MSTQVMSLPEINHFIEVYYGFLVEHPEKRQKLIETARRVTSRNRGIYGVPGIEGLQQTLDEVLDRSIGIFSESQLSLNRDLTGEGFTLEQVIAADKAAIPGSEHRLVPYTERSVAILKSLKGIMTEEDLSALISMLGGYENFVDLLGSTRLRPEEVRSLSDLSNIIQWLGQVPVTSRTLYAEYMQFLMGKKKYNPITTLTPHSVPVLSRIIVGAYEKGAILTPRLVELGFKRLINNNHGLTSIVQETNPELVHKIPRLKKWSNEESVKIALNAIQEVLYTIPGYQKAEENNNRDEQVRIINDFIERERLLVDYFHNNGLGGLMNNFLDPNGQNGLRKRSSPKALFEFYSEKKGLNWFDRTQESYVKAWKIKERDMWQNGDKSVKLALEAIEDVLYMLPGYKEAEKNNNRDEQVRIINDLIERESALQIYFYNNGLGGLMTSFLDPNGQNGLRKSSSPKALLEFYSEKKGLNWFDQSYGSYLSEHGRGKLALIQ